MTNGLNCVRSQVGHDPESSSGLGCIQKRDQAGVATGFQSVLPQEEEEPAVRFPYEDR